MPLYEYKCRTCGKSLEVIQKFSDVPLKVHQGCAGQLERLVSASALHFKGKGWYVTDYGRGGHLPANGDSAKADAKSESKPASGGDKKPDAPSEAKSATTKSASTKEKQA